MNKQNILRITLFVSVLVLNPAMAQINLRADMEATSKRTQTQSLNDAIYETLEAKGLEIDAATKLITEAELDMRVLEEMISNITKHTKVSKEQIIGFVANEVLFRKKITLEHYDTLLGMIYKITEQTPDEVTRYQLQLAAKENQSILTGTSNLA